MAALALLPALLTPLLAAAERAPPPPPPISLLTITPSSSSASVHRDPRPLPLAGHAAITATFSRAVIALGSDFGARELPDHLTPFVLHPPVAGRLRWVTTSVARFDPTHEWPAELDVALYLNPAMRSYDGALLTPDARDAAAAPAAPADAPAALGAPLRVFRTPALSMRAGSVRSEKALALTNGSWSASLHPLVPSAVELPPDGRLEVLFSADVALELLQGALTLTSDGGEAWSGGLSLLPCHAASPRCVSVAPSAPLRVGGTYSLVLPAGARFHPASGAVRAAVRLAVTGLVPFAFPFLSASSLKNVRFRRLRLWLRHGLAEGSDTQALAPLLALAPARGGPPLPLQLSRPAAHLLQVDAPMEPSTAYTLTVNGSPALHDGFGLPLQGSRVEFTTEPLRGLFLEPSAAGGGLLRLAAGPIALPAAWPALVRGERLCTEREELGCVHSQAQFATFTPVAPSDVRGAIAALHNWEKATVAEAERSITAPLVSDLRRIDYPLAPPSAAPHSLPPPLFLLHTLHGQWSRTTSLLSSGELAATAVAATDGSLVVWVLNTTSNAPVAAAPVEIYSHTCFRCRADDVQLAHRGTTDAAGLLRVERGALDERQRLSLLVRPPSKATRPAGWLFGGHDEEPGEALLIDALPSLVRLAAPPPVGIILTDRSVFKANDSLHVKGYVREQIDAALAAPRAASECKLSVAWKRGTPPTETLLSLDNEAASSHGVDVVYPQSDSPQAPPRRGAFSATLHVPPEADYKTHTISLSCRLPSAGDGWHHLASATVAVADPRPPTVSLDATTPARGFLRPGGTVELRLATATMTGLPVAGAAVKLRWSVQRAARRGPTPRAALPFRTTAVENGGEEEEERGEQQVLTDHAGVAVLHWRPANLTEQERVGDAINVELEWVGPTRERLTKSLKLPVALEEISVTLDVPSQAELPFHPFALRVGLHKLAALGGAAVGGVPIGVRLRPLSDDPEEGAPSHGEALLTDGPAEALPDVFSGGREGACLVTSSAEGAGAAECSLELPRVGRFAVAACALRHEGRREVCTAVVLGRSAAEWEGAPLSTYLQKAVSVATDRQSYGLGDVPQLLLTNPLSSPLRVLVVWGNRLHQRVHAPPAPFPRGAHSLPLLPLGEECSSGCEVDVYLAAPANVTRHLPVPTSALLDAALPMFSHHSLSLAVAAPSAELHLSIEPEAAVAAPSSRASFVLRLTDSNGKPSSGQVAIFAVDKAMLALRPHPTRNLSSELVPSLRAGFRSHSESYSQLISAVGLEYTARRLQQLHELDPWLPLDWAVQPGRSIVETPIARVLAQYTFELTDMPYTPFSFPEVAFDDAMESSEAEGMPHIMALGGALPLMAMARTASPSSEMVPERAVAKAKAAPPRGGGEEDDAPQASVARVKIRSSFETTPLFLPAVEVGPSGEAHVHWNLPDNTGAYELRAYAVSADAFGGGATAVQQVRKRLTMQASVPRIARVGDRLRCGVTVTASPELGQGTRIVGSLRQAAGVASGSRPPPLTLWSTTSAGASSVSTPVDMAQQYSAISPSEVVEMVFEIEATSLGEAVLIAEVKQLEGDASDALELRVPVLGVQPPVQVATSRSLAAAPKPSLWQEGIMLPDAVNGSGNLTLQLGAGHLPPLLSLSDALLRLPDQNDYISAPSLLASMAPAGMLAPYAGVDSAKQATERQLHTAASALAAMHDRHTGLHYSAEARAQAAREPERSVDLTLNAHALVLTRNLRLGGARLPASLLSMEAEWREALRSGLVAQVKRAFQRNLDWADWQTLVLCRLALGRTWSAASESARVQAVLSIDSLVNAVDSLPVFGKAALALTLQLPADPDGDNSRWVPPPPDAATQAILANLASSLRVTGRTAYVASSAASRASAGQRANAAALSALAFARRSSASPRLAANVDKLAAYVAELGASSDGLVWGVSFSSAFDGFALRDYDAATGSTAARVAVSVLAGSQPLLSSIVSSANPPPPTFVFSWSRLASPPPPLLFVLAGEGEVSVALGLSFVPAKLESHPVERGILVEKVIRRYSPELQGPEGVPLQAVELGSVVTVTLQITSPDELTNLLVEDWLPAGLEAIDPNAAGEEGSPVRREMQCPWWWWRCSAFERQTRKDSVSFYASWAYAGTHTLEYEAVAVTRGAFGLPPAKASPSLQPEVMGLSSGGIFHVKDLAEPGPPPRATGVPKRCYLDCSGRGRCDTSTGVCLCNPKSTGTGCEQEATLPVIGGVLSSGAGGQVFVSDTSSNVKADVLTGSQKTLTLSIDREDVPHAFALSGNEELLPSSSLHLAATSSRRLTLSIGAIPPVQEALCVPVMLAASIDGMQFGSKLLTLRLLPSSSSSYARECEGAPLWGFPIEPTSPPPAGWVSAPTFWVLLFLALAVASVVVRKLHIEMPVIWMWRHPDRSSSMQLEDAYLNQKANIVASGACSPPEGNTESDGTDESGADSRSNLVTRQA